MFTADPAQSSGEKEFHYETSFQGKTVVKSIRYDDIDSRAGLELRKRRFHRAYRDAMRHLGRRRGGLLGAMATLFSGLGYSSRADERKRDLRLQADQARDVWDSLNHFVRTTGKY